MTPIELRNSILKLAIEGKLTTQNLNDDSSIKLKLTLIKAKENLIANKTIKNEKNVEELSDVPFDIPDNWLWIRTGDCVSNKSGLSYNKESLDKKSDKMIRVFRGGNINDLSYVIKEDDVMISPEFNDPSLLLRKNWIITPAVTSLEHVGKMARIEKDYDDVVVGGFVLMLIPHIDNDVFSKYLLYAFSSGYYRNLCRGITNKSGQAFYNLSREKLMNIYIPLPPLEEQERIVAKIDELLPLVDRYEEAWNRLEDFNSKFPLDMEQSILKFAAQGKLVPQIEFEGNGSDLIKLIKAEKQQLINAKKLKKTRELPAITDDDYQYNIPSSWSLCYLDDIAFVTKLAGFEFTKYIAPNLLKEGIPLFKGKNVQNGKLVLEFESYISEELSDSLWRSQIIKKCLLTPYVGTIGNIAIFDGSFKAHLGSNVGKIELFNSNEIHVLEEYLLYYLRSVIGHEQLTKYLKATAQESISIDALRNVIVPLPPLAEQKRIVSKLEELLPLCRKLIK